MLWRWFWHRGRTGGPLYCPEYPAHRFWLLADKQHQLLLDLFKPEEHVEVEATWGIYQRMGPLTATSTGPAGRS